MSQNKKTTFMAPYGVPISVMEKAVEAAAKGKRKHKKKKKKNHPPKGMPSNPFARAFLLCLQDPFDFPPRPLGLGCMLETEIKSSFIRTSFVTNADGSFQVWFSPGQVALSASAANGGFLMADTAGAATTPTFAALANDAANRTNLLNTSDQYRIVAAGMRVFPLLAGTDKPGMISSGIYPADSGGRLPNNNGSAALTANLTFNGLPHNTVAKGDQAIQVTWRPVDIGTFDFRTYNTDSKSNAFSSDITPVGLLVSGVGFPASTAIWVEALAHYETYSYRSVGTSAGHETGTGSAGGGFPSIESLWNFIRPHLGPAVELASEYAKRNGYDSNGSFPKMKSFKQDESAWAFV